MLFIPSFVWHFFEHSTLLLTSHDLFGLSGQVLTSYDLFGLSNQVASQELAQNQLMIDSSGFPGIDSDQLMTQNVSRFKSTHDSSEKHLIPSRLMIRLWVIPMSGHNVIDLVPARKRWWKTHVWLNIRAIARSNIVKRVQYFKQYIISLKLN